MTRVLTSRRILNVGFVFALLVLDTGRQTLFAQVAKNSQQLTTEAWAAFNKADFKAAIAKAQECIRNFKDDADDKQEALRKKNTPEPPTDEFSASEREEILKRGPLNDVATSFFIIGESEEELYRREKDKDKDKDKDRDPQHNQRAKEAYKEACKYTYARTWDSSGKGFFWSPSKKACRRADRL
jgi:hypothetical protein